MYIYIYIYVLDCGVIVWSKFGLFRGYYLGQVCYKQHGLSKSSIKVRASAYFLKLARKNQGSLSGPRWPSLCCNNLDEIITPTWAEKMDFILIFCFQRCVLYLCLKCFSNINQKLPQSGPNKAITFHIVQNTVYTKKKFCCNPPLDQNWGFISCLFW